ncbi:MAG: hypothetical protein R3C09_05010 [Pirellulaceae bacterium]
MLNLFNAETEQAAGARGELIDRWDSDEPQRTPTQFRGLRRRQHLRQPPATPICALPILLSARALS